MIIYQFSEQKKEKETKLIVWPLRFIILFVIRKSQPQNTLKTIKTPFPMANSHVFIIAIHSF